MSGIGSTPRAMLRAVIFFLITGILVPPYLATLALTRGGAVRFARAWWRLNCFLFGAEVRRVGTPVDGRPVLFAANHASYLDIPILGATAAAPFVAKREVSSWPFFGFIARIGRTVFVERRPRASRDQLAEMMGRFEAGESLILFPEGTSSDGNRVLPFKSSLFAVAERRPRGEALQVQPVSIAYTCWDGVPLGRQWRPLYAWYGAMELAPHIWQVFKLGRVTVVVEFHAPVTVEEFGSRKALAAHCQRVVAAGVAGALTAPPAAESVPRLLRWQGPLDLGELGVSFSDL